jgi:hypothetical protein
MIKMLPVFLLAMPAASLAKVEDPTTVEQLFWSNCNPRSTMAPNQRLSKNESSRRVQSL